MQNIIAPLTIVNDYGHFSIATCDVPAAGQYLCLVTRHGLPFDMKIAKTIEEAEMNHGAFMMAAMLHTAVTDSQSETMN